MDESMAEKESIAELFEPLYNLGYNGCYVPLGALHMAFLLPFQTVPLLTISTERKKQVYVFCIFYTGLFFHYGIRSHIEIVAFNKEREKV